VEPASTYVALLHHPMRDRIGDTVTTALTTLDLHDMARTCRTFGIARFYVVHPIDPQRAIAERILRHWEGDEARHDYRGDALRRVRVVATLAEAEADVASAAGSRARLIATTAKEVAGNIGISSARALPGPALVLFGTGFGMTDELLARADHVLAPVIGPASAPDYNHLSVRSACAILLDRLYGDRKD
jgi:tRNA (guanine37-N1)-methyltransferase